LRPPPAPPTRCRAPFSALNRPPTAAVSPRPAAAEGRFGTRISVGLRGDFEALGDIFRGSIDFEMFFEYILV